MRRFCKLNRLRPANRHTQNLFGKDEDNTFGFSRECIQVCVRLLAERCATFGLLTRVDVFGLVVVRAENDIDRLTGLPLLLLTGHPLLLLTGLPLLLV